MAAIPLFLLSLKDEHGSTTTFITWFTGTLIREQTNVTENVQKMWNVIVL